MNRATRPGDRDHGAIDVRLRDQIGEQSVLWMKRSFCADWFGEKISISTSTDRKAGSLNAKRCERCRGVT